MLSQEDNELLTKVGPGTAMGSLLREYWQPVLYSYELPEADGTPLRVRLLGEDLIAFRNTGGEIGLLASRCPHRGAELFFGRNEENGLRCVYHGWKFDVAGKCVDMPNEPADSRFENKIKNIGYPCRETGGIIWAYMGQGTPPGLPELEWATTPDENRFMTKRYHECNWAQALEGDIDSCHVGFLHSELDKSVLGFGFDQVENGNYNKVGHNRSPKIYTHETDFGMWVAGRRPSDNDKYYWRATALVMPYCTMIPPSGDAPIHVNLWQPIDDENTLVWSIQYHGGRPLQEAEKVKLKSGLYEHFGPDDKAPVTAEAAGAWRSKANRANDFHIDREAQKSTSFTGLRGFWRQDRAVVESMGTVFDRTQEHLGSSDLGIIRFRKMYIDAARSFAKDGTLPPSVNPDTHRIRAVAAILPEEASWVDEITQLSEVKPGNWLQGP